MINNVSCSSQCCTSSYSYNSQDLFTHPTDSSHAGRYEQPHPSAACVLLELHWGLYFVLLLLPAEKKVWRGSKSYQPARMHSRDSMFGALTACSTLRFEPTAVSFFRSSSESSQPSSLHIRGGKVCRDTTQSSMLWAKMRSLVAQVPHILICRRSNTITASCSSHVVLVQGQTPR